MMVTILLKEYLVWKDKKYIFIYRSLQSWKKHVALQGYSLKSHVFPDMFHVASKYEKSLFQKRVYPMAAMDPVGNIHHLEPCLESRSFELEKVCFPLRPFIKQYQIFWHVSCCPKIWCIWFQKGLIQMAASCIFLSESFQVWTSKAPM